LTLRIRRDTSTAAIHIELSPPEARAFFEELLDVPGGARLPKLKQVCQGLGALFAPVEPQRKLSVLGKKR
jgi:hypothetical protein